MKTPFTQFAFCILLGLCTHFAAGQSQVRPNFVVILADDQSWNSTSVQMDSARLDSKSDYYATPQLDKLAQRGMTFSGGYSPAPKCSPSRISLLSGKSCARLKFTFTDNIREDSVRLLEPPTESEIPDSIHTIAEWLHAQEGWRYYTAHYGKWHIGGGGPENHGFDRGDGETGNEDGNHNGLIQSDPRKIFSITDSATVFIADAVQQGRPFYVQISHHAPRKPIEATLQTLQEWYDTKKHPLGKRHKDPEYAAMISDLDTGIGILLSKIASLGIDSNTYIIYLADNGAGGNNFPLSGGKAACQEGGIRVPFIIAGPGISGGSYCYTPVSGYDLYPTIAALAAGGSAYVLPAALDGTNLSPLLHPSNTPFIRTQSGLIFHCPHYNESTVPQSAILEGDLKLLVDYDQGNIALYNLRTDIGESTDISGKFPAIARMMTIHLRDYLKNVQARMVNLHPGYPAYAGSLADLDNDGLPDTWEFRELLSDRFKGEDDPDSDGRSNLEEWQQHSDPYQPDLPTLTFATEHPNLIFTCFPNPFNTYLQLDIAPIFQHQSLEWQLTDLFGKILIRQTKSMDSPYTLDTTTLASGTYFISAHTPSGLMQTQIIIKSMHP